MIVFLFRGSMTGEARACGQRAGIHVGVGQTRLSGLNRGAVSLALAARYGEE